MIGTAADNSPAHIPRGIPARPVIRRAYRGNAHLNPRTSPVELAKLPIHQANAGIPVPADRL
jgi:hypothetical protein